MSGSVTGRPNIRIVWWRDDPHPVTSDVVALLAELYHPPRSR
jgi:hypothetical protein